MEHDALREIQNIQNCLAENRKPLGFFLGAGCPVSVNVSQDPNERKPIIPDVRGLTSIINTSLRDEPSLVDKYNTFYNYLQNQQGLKEPTVEDILSFLRLIIKATGTGTFLDLTQQDLNDIEAEICKNISDEVDKEFMQTDTPYHDLAIWARSVARLVPIHLFTTNYDTLLEQALEKSSCPYFDGFVGSRRAFFDLAAIENEKLLPARWLRLWKIHGSINWKLTDSGEVVRTDTNPEGNYLIYPSHLKYEESRKMPYLAMLDRLKSFILLPQSVLFTIGYSFSDDHINDVIIQSLTSNPRAMVFALLYGQLNNPQYNKAVSLAKRTPNLTLIAFDGGVIGRKQGSWKAVGEDVLRSIPGVVLKKDIENPLVDANNDLKKLEVQLGNFQYFGQMLKEISVDALNDETNG